MDNLQKHYLAMLERAHESALHGNVERCLHICFDLRQKVDVALWVRAHVNITISELAKVESHPEKTKYAMEALRLVEELQNEPRPEKDAFWNEEFRKLKTSAEHALQRAQNAEKEYEEQWEGSKDVVQGAAATDDGSVWHEIDTTDLNEGTIEPFEIEGAFTYDLTGHAHADLEATLTHSGRALPGAARDTEEEVHTLPKAETTTGKGKRAQYLPTPDPSSEV